MTKAQRNLLRLPGLVIRVPLVLLYMLLERINSGIEWLVENVFKGLDP